MVSAVGGFAFVAKPPAAFSFRAEREAASGHFMRGTDVIPAPLPSSIRKRDGRVVPFEPEKLSRSLFAATEVMGAPDAFLARELTESIVHFLHLESGGDPVTSDHVVELAIKVLRELGQPALAKVYAEGIRTDCPPEREPQPRKSTELADSPNRDWLEPESDPLAILQKAARGELTEYSLGRVYPGDLVSAHREGLLQLLDLDIPQEMAGMVLPSHQPPPLDAWQLLQTLSQVRRMAGSFVALDGPEYAIVSREGIPEELAGQFHEILDRSLEISRLHGILNLNIAEPPAWASPLNMGPLFQEFQKEIESERLDRISLFLLRRARQQTVYWHLSESDFRDQALPRLREIITRSVARDGVEFVFDRPKQPTVLGPGIDRRLQAALGTVGIDLPRFVEHLGGGPLDPALYLKKLASLARFAKSAGHARQDYLRKKGRPSLHEGFLLERAVLIVLPMGTMQAARKVLLGESNLDAIADLACQSLQAIRTALETDRPRTMATRIDSPLEHPAVQSAIDDPDILPRQQLRYDSTLLAAAGGGCSTVRLNKTQPESAGDLTDLLRAAWRSDVPRLRFC